VCACVCVCVRVCVCVYTQPLQMANTLYRNVACTALFVPSCDTCERPLCCCRYEKCLSCCVYSRLRVDNKQVNSSVPLCLSLCESVKGKAKVSVQTL
jgi:hypothetical protein